MISQTSPPTSLDPVLEITLLTTNHSASPSLILTQLQNVRTLLADKVFPTHSRFYHSKVSNEVYILGFWPSLKKHQDFLADEKLSHEILSPQKKVMDWVWTRHLQLENESIDRVRERLRGSDMVEIKRWIVDVCGRDTFLAGLSESKDPAAEEPGQPFIAQGWEVEAGLNQADERSEFIRVKGWTTSGAVEMPSSLHQDSNHDATMPAFHHVLPCEVYTDME